MCITTTNFLNNIDYDKNEKVLVFYHDGNFFKVLSDQSIDLVEYANKNLLSGMKYKIFDNYNSIKILNIDELKLLFEDANIV